MIKGKMTYVSLFSSAGVGCYGFKESGFECIATSELLDKRMAIQRVNNKCKYDSGYIVGDIKDVETKNKIFKEIEKWKKEGNDSVDVLIATPPCQGMSVINLKKDNKDINRNSLIVESLQMVKEIQPKVFIFENVAAFMKTACTTLNGELKEIGEAVKDELSEDYLLYNEVINLKNYGSNSSRTRTIVIGVSKKLSDIVSPVELFPEFNPEKPLKEVIGHLPSLEWGEINDNDFYHQFRVYREDMRDWIRDLKEGESAFDNEDAFKRPHRIIDGKIVQNKQKTGDKYKRQYWDKVGACIHTRNDLLASQNTIHPVDDRVFSIRELMLLMSIPYSFKWVDKDLSELNSLSNEEKLNLLKKEEMTIRQSLGEAVPTEVFRNIALKTKEVLEKKHLTNTEIQKVIKDYKLETRENLLKFLKDNPMNLSLSSLSRLAELLNTKRENNAAYYTDKKLLNEVYKQLPEIKKDTIRVLEPSVGIGSFIPFIIQKYSYATKLIIDVIDIDEDSIEVLKILQGINRTPKNVEINYINHDFLTYQSEEIYDVVIGNPPFFKVKSGSLLTVYHNNVVNTETKNIFSFFLEKAIKMGKYVIMITPKNLLNTPEFHKTREVLNDYNIYSIIDLGEKGFKGVLIETICICINTLKKGGKTNISSVTLNIDIEQKQNYICDKELPYWVIYRNKKFDKFLKNMDFDIFTSFRDRQITNGKLLSNEEIKDIDKTNIIRVLKARNISDKGDKILDIGNYDAYILKDNIDNLTVSNYLDDTNVYLTPNMTYNPRVMRKPKGYLVNGSVAILTPKDSSLVMEEEDIIFYSSKEYREFYRVARNHQTRSLNIDSVSVYWFGKRVKEKGV